VISDRWSLLVLREAMFGNRRHFRILQERSDEAIAANIPADLRAAVPPSETSTEQPW
jgi:DNA-binding HxlR family transcriptional regulator